MTAHKRRQAPKPKGFGDNPNACGRCGAKDPETWTGQTGWICSTCLESIEKSKAMKLDATQTAEPSTATPEPEATPNDSGWDSLLGIAERAATAADVPEEVPAVVPAEAATEATPEVSAEAAPESQPEPSDTTTESVPGPIVDADDAEVSYRDELADAERDLANASIAVAEITASLKDAKSEQKIALTRVVAIRQRGPERFPLLDSSQPPVGEAATEVDHDPDGWRNVGVTRLDIPVGVAKLLIEAGFDTVGKIADWTATGNLLTDIAKIGEAKAEKIDAAFNAFWAAHPEYCRGS